MTNQNESKDCKQCGKEIGWTCICHLVNKKTNEAVVKEIPLSDGSKVYDVVVYGYEWDEKAEKDNLITKQLFFACENQEVAEKLVEALNRCVSISIA